MTPIFDTQSHPRISLRSTPRDPIDRFLGHQQRPWRPLESTLARPHTTRHLLGLIDQRWFAWRGIAHISYSAPSSIGYPSMAHPAIEANIDVQGAWALSTGLLVATSPPPFPSDPWSCLGPHCLARHVRRFGLKGYLTALCLPNYPAVANIYSPPAYLQQIIAGAIEHPLATAYLRAGAEVLGHCPADDAPIMILRWTA